jgi:hypothetical protein
MSFNRRAAGNVVVSTAAAGVSATGAADARTAIDADTFDRYNALEIFSDVPLLAASKTARIGSAYSSSAAFIEAVHPRIAIVSVGRHNLFGHPAASTLETLRVAGASIFRTDQCGAVTVTTGAAAKLEVETMLSCTTAFRSHG